MREVRDNFKVDAFVGNATDWEKVCVGNLVGMPVIVVPTGFKQISDAPTSNTRRRSTISTGVYAPPEHDHIVRTFHFFFLVHFMCCFACLLLAYCHIVSSRFLRTDQLFRLKGYSY